MTHMTVTDERATVSRPTYVGGLDGLRAIAVAAVIVYHFAPSVLPAGFLGVDVFFVVSGFLIARLVVARDRRHRQRWGCDTFWARRARRLLPALGTVTVVVLCAVAINSSSAEMHDIRAQALGTLFYCVELGDDLREGQLLHERRPAVAVPAHVDARGRGAVLRRVPARVLRGAAVDRAPSGAGGGRRACSARSRRRCGWRCSCRRPATRRARISAATRTRWVCSSGVALGVLAGAGATVGASMASALRSSRVLARVAAGARGRVAHRDPRDDARRRAITRYALYRGGFLVFALLCAVIVVVVVTLPDAADREDAPHAVAGRDRAALVLAVPVALAGARVRHAALRASTASALFVGPARRSRSCSPRSRTASSSGRSASARSRSGRGAAGAIAVLRRAHVSSRRCSSPPSPRP